MTPQDRVAFVSEAITDGDLEIMTAILNASPFVSGLDHTQMSWLREEAPPIVPKLHPWASLRWPRLSEQFFRVDKWSVCRG